MGKQEIRILKEGLSYFAENLKYLRLFHRRRDAPQGRSLEYWEKESRRYSNMMKWIRGRGSHWYVIEYHDGYKELAYLRVLQGGMLSGMYPAIYRGFYPMMITTADFSFFKDITPAY